MFVKPSSFRGQRISPAVPKLNYSQRLLPYRSGNTTPILKSILNYLRVVGNTVYLHLTLFCHCKLSNSGLRLLKKKRHCWAQPCGSPLAPRTLNIMFSIISDVLQILFFVSVFYSSSSPVRVGDSIFRSSIFRSFES